MSKEIDITSELHCNDELESAKIVVTDDVLEIKFKYLPSMTEEDKVLFEGCIITEFIKNMVEGSKLGIKEIKIKRVESEAEQ